MKNNHDLNPKPHKIEAFDGRTITLFKELSDRNNDLTALLHQEEETRLKLINLKKAIHDLKKGDKIRITDILVPMGGFYRHLQHSEKDEFIQHHIDTYNNLENQYMGITSQRIHREDEFGECIMRLMKNLWQKTKMSYKYTDEEMIDALKNAGKPYVPSLIDENSVNTVINQQIMQEGKK